LASLSPDILLHEVDRKGIMSALVQLTKTLGIAVVTINNPPVNALSSAVASGIAAAVAQIEKDDTVPAAIFIGAGRTFIAGADIKEFGEFSSRRGVAA